MSDGVEANEPVATFGNVVDFSKVFESEITLINRRRHAAKDPRGQIAIEIEAHSDLAGERVLRPKEEAAGVGLALSGGGLRSSLRRRARRFRRRHSFGGILPWSTPSDA